MVIESMFILKCEYTVQRMVALNVFNEVMSLLTSFADSHVTYLSVRLLLLALLRLAEEWSGNSDADGHKDVGDVKCQQKDTL